MAVQWTNDLATDVKEIDDQHKELFRRVDSLVEACRGGKGREEVSKIVQFLAEYVTLHFGAEERYMGKFGYTNAAGHMAQHAQFVKTFLRLRERMLIEGAGAHLIEDLNTLVVDWLKSHIKYSDKALGLFLKHKL
jgi:hemerythrin